VRSASETLISSLGYRATLSNPSLGRGSENWAAIHSDLE